MTDTLDERGLQYDVEHKRIVKYGEERTFTHIHLHDGHKFELTLYPEDKVHYVFKSSITGKAIERASIAELEEILCAPNPGIDLEAEVERLEDRLDPYMLFRMLLGAAGGGQAKPEVPSGRRCPLPQPAGLRTGADERPYDEEFLLAALLHDVGKAIDPADHVAAALQGSGRRHYRAHRVAYRPPHGGAGVRLGTLGVKARARIQASEYYDDLMLLNELDRRGRVRGAAVCELDLALEFLRELADEELES